MSNLDNESQGPEGTIPVDEAAEMTKNWRDYLKSTNQEFAARSFLIPIVDFQNILKYNPDAEAVRAYVGLKEIDGSKSSKLVLVPVVDGKDVLFQSTEGIQGLGVEPESNVYDFTTTCPPVCTIDESILNG